MKKYEDLLFKLEAAGEDEVAIEQVFTEYYNLGAETEELTEDDLDNVAGGFSEWDALKWLAKNTKLGKCTWKCTKVATVCVIDMVVHGDPFKTYSKKEVEKYTKELDKATPGWMKKLQSLGV